MKTARIDTLENLKLFIQETFEASRFRLEVVPIDSQDAWQVNHGMLSHKTGGFFHAVGYREEDKEELCLYQPQSALTGIMFTVQDGEPYVLLQARAEPGNTVPVQCGPTVQSTMGNYLRMHGGRKTSFLEHFMAFSPKSKPIWKAENMDLGDRYFQKTKCFQYIEAEDFLPVEDKSMAWVSLSVLQKAMKVDYLINPDFRSLLVAFDWDAYLARSPFQVSHVPYPNTTGDGYPKGSFIPLDELNGWEKKPHGWEKEGNNGVSMYHVNLETREVASWYQPLLVNHSDLFGKVVLLRKEENGEAQFLIKFAQEMGTVFYQSALPSFLVIPGQKEDKLDEAMARSKVLAETKICDEGGRFYRYDSNYYLVEYDKQLHAGADGKWLNARELKALLLTSNQTSIQLRMVCGLVFDELNPEFFRKA